MKFNYGDTFRASRYTGYEVMIYSCSHGDATLFSRGDLVEAAWRGAQPLLDYWKTTPADFPNYARGSWGPTAASDLIERDGRRWFEVLSDEHFGFIKALRLPTFTVDGTTESTTAWVSRSMSTGCGRATRRRLRARPAGNHSAYDVWYRLYI